MWSSNRVKSLSDWDALYGKVNGKYHDGIVGGFTAYGIPADKITFINYFTDTKETAAQKIKAADIIYFLGGLPDRMMDRIKEFDLYDVLMQHDGILMGYSAGAVIQLAEYHLSPDDDYPEFKYYEGLPYTKQSFCLSSRCRNPLSAHSLPKCVFQRLYAQFSQAPAL